jgi:hypothetical protein
MSSALSPFSTLNWWPDISVVGTFLHSGRKQTNVFVGNKNIEIPFSATCVGMLQAGKAVLTSLAVVSPSKAKAYQPVVLPLRTDTQDC